MDNVQVPVKKQKKPFPFAAITFVFASLIIFGRACLPVINWFLQGHNFSTLTTSLSIPFVLSVSFVALCLLCVAVAMFFKKSNIFLIVSLFAAAVGFLWFTTSNMSALFNQLSFITVGSEEYFRMLKNYIPLIAADACNALAFIVLGITAVLARLKKVKATNIWILASLLLAVAAFCLSLDFVNVLLNFVPIIKNEFETFAYVDSVPPLSYIFVYYSIIADSAIYLSATVMTLLSSLLAGLYLKKLAKQA